MNKNNKDKTLDRRELLAGMAGLSAMSMVPPAFAQAAQAAAAQRLLLAVRFWSYSSSQGATMV